jgi:hypothetical protein
MPTLPQPTQGGDFTPPPAGSFPAICYRVIDLGRQKSTFNNETKIAHKIMISWEIADEDERMPDGRPFTISKRYTWSMHEKSTLRKHLEAWRGVPFKDSDFGEGGFDIKRLIGVPCMLSIVLNEKDGTTYGNVSSVAKMPKQMTAAPLVNPTAFLWLEKGEFNRTVFDGLSESLRNTIAASPEYAMMRNGGSVEQIKSLANNAGAHMDDDDLAGLEVRG